MSIKVTTVCRQELVEIEGKDKKEEGFFLREMSAEKRDAYLDKVSERVRYDSSGKAVGMKDMKGFQADLVCLCLYRADGTLVPKTVIQEWPSSTVSVLFTAAQKLNDIGQGKEEGGPKNG